MSTCLNICPSKKLMHKTGEIGYPKIQFTVIHEVHRQYWELQMGLGVWEILVLSVEMVIENKKVLNGPEPRETHMASTQDWLGGGDPALVEWNWRCLWNPEKQVQFPAQHRGLRICCNWCLDLIPGPGTRYTVGWLETNKQQQKENTE